MKKITLLGLLFLPFLLIAQIPSYYNDVNLNLTGTALKDELATKIINTHTLFLSYSQVWDASKVTDLDPNDATQSNVILVYGYNDNDGNYITDRTRSKNANGGTSGTDWNREHSYAKSLGTPNLGTSGPGSDAHHLRPADVTFNGQRGSKKFASGSGHAGDSNGGWYAGDEWKGDISRMMMYMYLRYGSQCLPTGVGIGSSSSTPDAMIDLFLQWNVDDPISQLEINRNSYHGNTANNFAQGNRNPFIDNPAFATQIWGGPQAEDLFGGGGSTDTEAPTTPINLIASNTTQTTTELLWTASTDNVGVTGYDVYKNGSILASTASTSYSVTGLTASTLNTFTVKAKDAANNTSANSNTATITTLSGGGGSGLSELFFSEYIEGSSYNKALEIANFTGNAVDLSAFSIKKQSNGAGSWSGGITLSGQLANGDVFVAVNSNASSTILAVADLTSTGSELSFNGNDAVGLFKNGTLIDIIGTFNGGSSNFAKDQTLRRKETVTSPSITFDKTGEWDTFAKDTFDGLGAHTTSGGGNQDTEAPSAPSSLAANTITETSVGLTWNASTDNIGVTGYDIYKDGSLLTSIASTSYSVTGLTASTSYTFVVTAKDAAGNTSANSNTVNSTTVDNTAPTVPTGLSASNTTQTSTDLTWNASTDNVGVTGYDIYKDGVLLASTASAFYSVTGLIASTSYAFTVTAKDAVNNTSSVSNTANVTTQSSGGGGGSGSELFISEYIEGSSNNKAIEIVNFTGNTIDLSSYSLKRNTNGGTAWGTALNLSGQLIDGDVFVVANSSATATILNVADLVSSADAIVFNGNDPVGLFKNNMLIDIVGNFNGGSANFAADVTLRRIETVANPSITYTTSEWSSFAIDTFDGLGTHTTSGGGGGTITDILLEHSFESGWDGWIDGGSDCYRINSSRSFDGNYSIRIRDNSGAASAMTSSNYDVTAYDNLEVKFNFYSYSMETNEDFWLQYYNGSSWQTVQTFVSGTDFSNNVFTEATVNISSSTYNFSVNTQFKFQCDASSNSDAIYIDNVIITATSGVVAKNFSTNSIIPLGKEVGFNEELIEIEGTRLYPNPAANNHTLLRTELDIEDDSVDVQITVVNIQGRLMKRILLDEVQNEFFEHHIDLSNLKNGLYFVNITTSKGFSETKKIVIK